MVNVGAQRITRDKTMMKFGVHIWNARAPKFMHILPVYSSEPCEVTAVQVRGGLAELGLKSLDELIGRADLLKQRQMELAKTASLDLSFLTTYAGPVATSSSRRTQCVVTLDCYVPCEYPCAEPFPF